MAVVDKLARAMQFFRSFTLINFYQQYPRTYLSTVSLAALAGYLYLLLFPLGTLVGGYQFYLSVSAPFSAQTLLGVLTWLSLTLFCVGITHGIATLRFKNPEGILLQREKAQLVFNKLDEISELSRWPKIHNVILTRRFELNIIKTPVYGMPFWSRNTLVVGYPFMQTLSPEYFDCALARKILQFAKRKNLFLNWLSYLRYTWSLYPETFKQRNLVGDQLGHWFFRYYGRFYRYYAIYATQQDELCADTLALNHMNDRDVFKTAESIRLVKMFLNQHYWPKLAELLSNKTVTPQQIRPYDHLSKTASQMMRSSRINHWLKLLSLEQQCKGSHDAPFAKRMERMGYGKVHVPDPFNNNAAQYYFGPDNNALIQYMNNLWASHTTREIRQLRNKDTRKAITSVDPIKVVF